LAEAIEVRAVQARSCHNPVEVDISSSTEAVVLKSSAPAKGVVVVSAPIEADKDAEFADNFVNLVPGEEIRIAA
jgi:beta-mannosidase